MISDSLGNCLHTLGVEFLIQNAVETPLKISPGGN